MKKYVYLFIILSAGIGLWLGRPTPYMPILRIEVPFQRLKFNHQGSMVALVDEFRIQFGMFDGSRIELVSAHITSNQAFGPIEFDHTDTRLAVGFDLVTRPHGASTNLVELWEVNTASLLQHFSCAGLKTVTTVVFSPNNTYLAAGGLNGSVCVWDILSGQELYNVNQSSTHVTSLEFSSTADLLAVGDIASHVALLDMQTGTVTEDVTLPVKSLDYGQMSDISVVKFFDHDSKLIIGSWNSNLVIWDVLTHQRIQEIGIPHRPIMDLQLSSDEQYIVVLSGDVDEPFMGFPGRDDTPYVYTIDLATSQVVCTIKNQPIHVNSIFLHSTSPMLITANYRGEIYLWNFPCA